MAQPRIGVIGLGSLGGNMCRLLREDGYQVHGYDIDPERREAIRDSGTQPAESAAALARAVDQVVLSLPQSDAVEAACLGADGVLEGGRDGLLVIDTTSGYPDRTRHIAARLHEAGIALVDAAITGEEGGAGALPKRALTFCVGGAPEHVEAARPVLERMARYIYHVGPLGAGQIVKMINNMVCSAAGVAAIEGLLVAAKHGIDVEQAAQVLDKGTGMNFFCKHPELLTARGLKGGFQVGLMTKDLRHMSQFAKDSGVPAFMTDHTFHLYELFTRRLGYDGDILQQIEVLEEWAGVRMNGESV